MATALKFFTGELSPHLYPQPVEYKDSKKRRLFMDELTEDDRRIVLDFLNLKKHRIISDAIMGRGALKADYVLVTERDTDKYRWIIVDITTACDHYSTGNVGMTPRGSLKIGRITAQRKGGTPDPESLQFKMNPLHLFELGHDQ